MKNVIFDFGNTIIDFNPERFVSLTTNNKKAIKEIVDNVYLSKEWRKVDSNEMSEKEFIESRKKYFSNEEIYNLAVESFSHWKEHLFINEDMKKIIIDLKNRGDHLYILSNISKEFGEEYHHYPYLAELFSYFDGCVFSGDIKVAKPDPKIYQYIIDKYNLDVRNTYFIDDLKTNCDVAQNLGISSYVFDNNIAKLKEFLDL